MIHNTQDKYFRTQALLLNNIDETSQIKVLDNFHKLQERCMIESECLGKIDSDNEIAINALVELIHPTHDEYIQDDFTRYKAAGTLGIIDPGNEIAISTLVDVIKTQKEWGIVSDALRYLGEVGTGNKMAINALVDLIQNGWDADEILAETLGEIDPGNEVAITTLVKLILDGGDVDEIVANRLERILQGEQYAKVVIALKHYMTDHVFNNLQYFYFYKACQDVLWQCAQNMSYPDFYRAWHGEPSSV
jgi:HEAT repeat protein